VPTYEYHCSRCKANYDMLESFSAPSSHTCERCGKGTAKRVLVAPRVVFKGSGWYATDSRNSRESASEGARAEGSKPEPAASDGPSSGGGSASKTKSEPAKGSSSSEAAAAS
jgi:putative FmdB family regulatory protein